MCMQSLNVAQSMIRKRTKSIVAKSRNAHQIDFGEQFLASCMHFSIANELKRRKKRQSGTKKETHSLFVA